MAAVPVMFEQMQQFRAEVDGRIAATQATSAASFQAASAQKQKGIGQAVEGKFSEWSDRVMGLFDSHKVCMDAIANKVTEEELAFDLRAQQFDAKMKELSGRIAAVGFDHLVRNGGWCCKCQSRV